MIKCPVSQKGLARDSSAEPRVACEAIQTPPKRPWTLTELQRRCTFWHPLLNQNLQRGLASHNLLPMADRALLFDLGDTEWDVCVHSVCGAYVTAPERSSWLNPPQWHSNRCPAILPETEPTHTTYSGGLGFFPTAFILLWSDSDVKMPGTIQS